MRIALVRGYQASPYEMQSFLPLLADGFEITVFTNRRPMFRLPADLEVVQLPSPMDRVPQGHGRWAAARRYLRWRLGRNENRLDGLEARLVAGRFDVVHTMETFNAFSHQALAACQSTGAPLVVSVWENIPFRYSGNGAVHRGAHAFVAATRSIASALRLEGAPSERFHSIPMGVDLRGFRAGRNDAWRGQHGIPSDALLFLFAARMVWEKGLFDVLHALRLLQLEHGIEAHLVVTGSGDAAAFKVRAKQLGIDGRVHFVGHLPDYAMMPDVFRAADAFVLASLPTPTWQEQFGMVLVEAMATGLPIIATRSGSIPEVVGDAGILVGPGDAPGIADAMLRLAHVHERERLGGLGAQRARTLYDAQVVAQQLKALYATIAEGTRPLSAKAK